MTSLDLAVQKVDRKEDIGFVKAASRVNVALTRGRGVVWTAGGSCEGRWQKYIPAIAAFRHHRVQRGLCRIVPAPKIPDSKIPPQLLGFDYPSFSQRMTKDDQANADDGDDLELSLDCTSKPSVVH